MRVAVFSTKPYDERFLREANRDQRHELVFLEPRLVAGTAALSVGCEAVCAFVNDDLSAPVLKHLADNGVTLVALRSAGFNHVDLSAAMAYGLTVVFVPGYSPYAVAEHCVGLIMALNRKIHRAYNRIRESNFSLTGLLGFDVHGKTVGVVGTGKVGSSFARIMLGFGCRVLAFDPYPRDECRAMGIEYVTLNTLCEQSDIIALHCPLMPETHHLIDQQRLSQMKDGVMLINTSRGALIDTLAVIDALKSGKVGYLGLDVYEEEAGLFFEDLSNTMPRDEVFSLLTIFPNVLITGHQGFFTREALDNIASTTIDNMTAFESGHGPIHRVSLTG